MQWWTRWRSHLGNNGSISSSHFFVRQRQQLWKWNHLWRIGFLWVRWTWYERSKCHLLKGDSLFDKLSQLSQRNTVHRHPIGTRWHFQTFSGCFLTSTTCILPSLSRHPLKCFPVGVSCSSTPLPTPFFFKKKELKMVKRELIFELKSCWNNIHLEFLINGDWKLVCSPYKCLHAIENVVKNEFPEQSSLLFRISVQMDDPHLLCNGCLSRSSRSFFLFL